MTVLLVGAYWALPELPNRLDSLLFLRLGLFFLFCVAFRPAGRAEAAAKRASDGAIFTGRKEQ